MNKTTFMHVYGVIAEGRANSREGGERGSEGIQGVKGRQRATYSKQDV